MSVARRNLIDGGYAVILLAFAIGNGYLLLPSTADTRELATVSMVIPVPGSAVSPPPPVITVSRSSAPARSIAGVPKPGDLVQPLPPQWRRSAPRQCAEAR